MRLSLPKRSRRALLASIMLVAFASRALIPPGFMPASGRPLSFEVCWEGLPAAVLAHVEHAHADLLGTDSKEVDSTSHRGHLQRAHSHHSGSPSHGDHCVFGTACSAGPIPHLPPLIAISFAQQLRPLAFVSIAGAVRLVHLPQPRAPPGQLS
jgi:hypothetical protein